MAALCFKYLYVSVEIKGCEVTHPAIMPDIRVELKRAGITVEEIISLCLEKSTQCGKHSPTNKHNAENTSEPEKPVMTRLCNWRWLSLLLPGWWWFMVNNNSLVSLLNHLILGRVADRASWRSDRRLPVIIL